MTYLTMLWLPTVLSAVVVFIVSSIIHMATAWHKSDYPKVPDETRVMDALRPLGIPPGDYMMPCPSSPKELRSPEFVEKRRKGPVMVFTVLRGDDAMASSLVLWFVFCLVVGLFAAYVAGRALPPGAPYRSVFRFAGVTAFLAYAGALWPLSIWLRRKWVTTIKGTIDGLIYALLTAGVFGWLWPKG